MSDDWDFWTDEVKSLHCVGYNSKIDYDALAVLEGIQFKEYCTEIATKTGLPAEYVELLQSIFCSAGWAEYGTSPRGCWLTKSGETGISKFAAYVEARWGRRKA